MSILIPEKMRYRVLYPMLWVIGRTSIALLSLAMAITLVCPIVQWPLTRECYVAIV